MFKTPRLMLATFGFLTLFASTTQAQQAGLSVLTFNDALTNLSGANRGLVSGHAGRTAATAHAKVIVNNTSTGVRAVDCRLEFPGLSGDIASVTLAPGAFATLSMQVARGVTAADIRANLSCRVTTAANTGVFAQWSKITTEFTNAVLVGFGG